MEQALHNSLHSITELFHKRMSEFEAELGRGAAAPATLTSLADEFSTFKNFILESLGTLNKQVELLAAAVDRLETRGRRKMLLLHGVPEKDKENPQDAAVRIVQDKLLRTPVVMKNKNDKGREIITVPFANAVNNPNFLTNINAKKNMSNYSSELPDQETIRKCEDLELEFNELSNSPDQTVLPDHIADKISTQANWQQFVDTLAHMKNDLGDRQRAILKLYMSMKNTYHKMSSMAQNVTMPPSDDLMIMNVGKLSPTQLLQLCDTKQMDTLQENGSLEQSGAINTKTLYNLPTKLIATCEHTLCKRREIIDWFIALKKEEKVVSLITLESKINEFTAENEMLACSLDQAKAEFNKEILDVVEFVKKTVNEAVALQLRTEEQTYKLSELDSQNSDLRKKIHNSELLRSNKQRIEELEKDLKEEKCKTKLLKERFSKAEGQVKIGTDRASQLEAALEQARQQTRTLERNNAKLQADFDKELRKLTDSIHKNTSHLEEIAEARTKLQDEKEDLEKRLDQLSKSYDDSHNSIRHEMNVNLAKLLETEKKCQEAEDDKKEAFAKLEATRAESKVYELKNIELLNKIEEYETQIAKAKVFENDLKTTKHDLELKLNDIESYKGRLAKQDETIKHLQDDLDNTLRMKDKLKSNLTTRDEYIVELEKKQSLQERELRGCEDKMNSYEDQLSSLKNRLCKLQEEFGELENMSSLREEVNYQRVKLLEITKQNEELTKDLQNKDKELQQFSTQTKLLEQRNGVIKMLSEKEVEQNNIIKLLRNNLEMRTHADVDLSRQINEKRTEVGSLVANLETRKRQISQLEKIILTLEEQNRKSSVQWRKDQDKIKSLEKQLAEHEGYHIECKHVDEIPGTNLDSIIKILEEELCSSIDPPNARISSPMLTKKYIDDVKNNCQTGNKMYQMENNLRSANTVLGTYVQKTYVSNTEKCDQHKNDTFVQLGSDNLDRKKGITHIDTEMWVTDPDAELNYIRPVKENNYSRLRGLPLLSNTNLNANLKYTRNTVFSNGKHNRDDKKFRMLKLAGHRL